MLLESAYGGRERRNSGESLKWVPKVQGTPHGELNLSGKRTGEPSGKRLSIAHSIMIGIVNKSEVDRMVEYTEGTMKSSAIRRWPILFR